MADEIKIQYGNASLYARVYDITGQVWNISGEPAWEAWMDGNVADYVVSLTNQDSGEHLGDFPSGIAAGTYQIIAYKGTGVLTDVPVSSIGKIIWDGSAEVPLTSQDDVTTAHGTTDALITAISSSVLSVLNIYNDAGVTKTGGTYPTIEDGKGGVYA